MVIRSRGGGQPTNRIFLGGRPRERTKGLRRLPRNGRKAFAPAREYYRKLRVPGRAVFHMFEGGHMAHEDEAMRFLHRYLRRKQ
jgi:hypothetical protein